MKPLEVAISAVQQAGNILLESWGKLQSLEIKNKDRFDYVTKVDRDSEHLIIDILRENFPYHTIIAEESGKYQQDNLYQWYVDPLDGTTNYIHGFPFCAISIALSYKEEIILGVIYNPISKELFSAEKNRGAFLNNRRIKVSKETELSRCLIATGFPFKNKHLLRPYWQALSSIFLKVSGVRRAGSAALDLAYVASGRCDGFWEIKLSPWDIAAGDILIREAGGKLTDMEGKQNHIATGDIIATNGFIHDHILSIIKSVFKNNP